MCIIMLRNAKRFSKESDDVYLGPGSVGRQLNKIMNQSHESKNKYLMYSDQLKGSVSVNSLDTLVKVLLCSKQFISRI